MMPAPGGMRVVTGFVALAVLTAVCSAEMPIGCDGSRYLILPDEQTQGFYDRCTT